MSLASDLRSWLITCPETVAFVGTRVYPHKLKQTATLPAITYMRVDGRPGVTHNGPTGVSRPRFQLDCYASTYLTAEAMAAAVNIALHARGWLSNFSFVVNDLDSYDPETDIYGRTIDVFIWRKE